MLARKSARSTETVLTKLLPSNQNLKFGPPKRFHDKPFHQNSERKGIKNLSTKRFLLILMKDPGSAYRSFYFQCKYEDTDHTVTTVLVIAG